MRSYPAQLCQRGVVDQERDAVDGYGPQEAGREATEEDAKAVLCVQRAGDREETGAMGRRVKRAALDVGLDDISRDCEGPRRNARRRTPQQVHPHGVRGWCGCPAVGMRAGRGVLPVPSIVPPLGGFVGQEIEAKGGRISPHGRHPTTHEAGVPSMCHNAVDRLPHAGTVRGGSRQLLLHLDVFKGGQCDGLHESRPSTRQVQRQGRVHVRGATDRCDGVMRRRGQSSSDGRRQEVPPLLQRPQPAAVRAKHQEIVGRLPQAGHQRALEESSHALRAHRVTQAPPRAPPRLPLPASSLCLHARLDHVKGGAAQHADDAAHCSRRRIQAAAVADASDARERGEHRGGGGESAWRPPKCTRVPAPEIHDFTRSPRPPGKDSVHGDRWARDSMREASAAGAAIDLLF